MKCSTDLIAIDCLAVFACSGLLCFSGFVYAAPKNPALEVTTPPAASTQEPIVKIEGKVNFDYKAYAVADDTIFDLTGMISGPKDDHPAATVFTAGQQPKPPTNLCIVGGMIHGKNPLEWSWTLTHAFGGSAFLICANGLQSVEGVRIHNMQDGWRPRETPEFLPRAYPNTGRFLMRDCYVTGIRDDVIENDEFLPGDVEDSLFDGFFTFFSE